MIPQAITLPSSAKHNNTLGSNAGTTRLGAWASASKPGVSDSTSESADPSGSGCVRSAGVSSLMACHWFTCQIILHRQESLLLRHGLDVQVRAAPVSEHYLCGCGRVFDAIACVTVEAQAVASKTVPQPH